MFYICLIMYITVRLFYNDITNNGMLVWCYGVRSLFLILVLMNAPFECIGLKTGYAFSFWVFAVHYYLDGIIGAYVSRWVSVLGTQVLSWSIVLVLSIMSGMILRFVSPKFFSLLVGNRNDKCNYSTSRLGHIDFWSKQKK